MIFSILFIYYVEWELVKNIPLVNDARPLLRINENSISVKNSYSLNITIRWVWIKRGYKSILKLCFEPENQKASKYFIHFMISKYQLSTFNKLYFEAL